MDMTRLPGVIVLVLSSVVAFLFAYLIGVRGRTGLISGHVQGTARDERGLARWTGGWMAATGVTMLAFAAVLPAMSVPAMRPWSISLVVVLSLTGGILWLGMGRYR